MKKTLIAISLVAVLTGCGKEQFSDPQKFAEHYGRELLGEHFKSGMELMGYEGFEFANAKVGIDRNGREYVSAQVSITFPHGEKYYRRLPSQSSANILKDWPSDGLSHVVGQEDARAIVDAYRKVRRDGDAPVVYSADSIDLKALVSPWRTIRIVRLKDGEGVYHPAGDIEHAIRWYAADGDEMSEVSHIPTEPFYAGPDGLLSETAIKRLGATRDGTSAAIQACESHVRKLEALNAAIARLNACCATQTEILAKAPSYATTNALPNWIWIRQKKAASDVQSRIGDARNLADERNREAKDAVRNAQNTLGRLRSQVAKAEKAVLRAKKNLEEDTKQLERLTAIAAKARRPSERSNAKLEQVRERVETSGPKAIADAESALADLKAKMQSAEASVADAKANQDKAAAEGQSAIAKAETDGQKSLSQAAEKLQDEYQTLKQKCSAELKAAVDDCKRMLGLAR